VVRGAGEIRHLEPGPGPACDISNHRARTVAGTGRGQAAVRAGAQQAPASTQALQGLGRKWGGSHEAIFEFARWASGQAPDGHSGHKLIALAHIEMWLDAEKGEPQRTYFVAKPVKQEVMAAARRSILSPNYSRDGSVLSWPDRNIFAFCFRLMRDFGAQLEQMRPCFADTVGVYRT
jgi:hypothetical protein